MEVFLNDLIVKSRNLQNEPYPYVVCQGIPDDVVTQVLRDAHARDLAVTLEHENLSALIRESFDLAAVPPPSARSFVFPVEPPSHFGREAAAAYRERAREIDSLRLDAAHLSAKKDAADTKADVLQSVHLSVLENWNETGGQNNPKRLKK